MNREYVAILDKSYRGCIYVFYFHPKKEHPIPSGVLMYDSYNRKTGSHKVSDTWRGSGIKLTKEAWLRQLSHNYRCTDDSTLTTINTRMDVDKYMMTMELLK